MNCAKLSIVEHVKERDTDNHEETKILILTANHCLAIHKTEGAAIIFSVKD